MLPIPSECEWLGKPNAWWQCDVKLLGNCPIELVSKQRVISDFQLMTCSVKTGSNLMITFFPHLNIPHYITDDLDSSPTSVKVKLIISRARLTNWWLTQTGGSPSTIYINLTHQTRFHFSAFCSKLVSPSFTAFQTSFYCTIYMLFSPWKFVCYTLYWMAFIACIKIKASWNHNDGLTSCQTEP